MNRSLRMLRLAGKAVFTRPASTFLVVKLETIFRVATEQ